MSIPLYAPRRLLTIILRAGYSVHSLALVADSFHMVRLISPPYRNTLRDSMILTSIGTAE